MTSTPDPNAVQKLPVSHKLAYGAGAFTNNLLAAASGGLMVVLNLGFGMSPILVGLLGSIPRFFDALTDPVMGYVSDNTKSRWGRRRPYIFVGVFIAAVTFAAMWQIGEGHSTGFYFAFFLAFLIVFFVGYTIYATPWVALGYELTPDYHDRTTLMGVQNAMGQIPFLVLAPWFLWFMELDTFGGLTNGASWLAICVALICVAFGVIPAIFLRERFVDRGKGAAQEGLKQEFLKFFIGIKRTFANLDFLKLAGATFLVFNGFQMIGAFQLYVIIFYVYSGDADAAGRLLGYLGTIAAVATIAVIAITTALSRFIGKKKTFFVCIGISVFGYLLKWFCYDPNNPYLILVTAPFIAFGLGSLFTLMGAMIADVCDADEVVTGERREGMYGSIFWWVVKLGMTLALALGGVLLVATGFDVDLEQQSEQTLYLMRLFDVVVPAVTSLLAILLISRYKLTEEAILEVRRQLDVRVATAAQ